MEIVGKKYSLINVIENFQNIVQIILDQGVSASNGQYKIEKSSLAYLCFQNEDYMQ